ncbi:MAG: ribonucleoprotein [Candidatus Bathyarchaeota archaeon]|nr:MAG: ribonucleoprotein [Candidatus Bathyarchaeota archaeon]
MDPSRRPLNFLMRGINNKVIVKLKNNLEYKGRMVKCDNYMNILLEGASEFYNSNLIANYGKIFIRGNNVLYICLKADILP